MATSNFGSAFAAARKAGDKTFEFNGKKFTTESREERKSAMGKKDDSMRNASRATSVAESGNPGRRPAPVPKEGVLASVKRAASTVNSGMGKAADKVGSMMRGTADARSDKLRNAAREANKEAPRPVSKPPVQDEKNDRMPTSRSLASREDEDAPTRSMKKGGSVRGDGCATKGKTKGRTV